MTTKLIVRGAPQYYECREGILDQLEELLIERKIHKCLMFHGEKSLKAAQPYLPSFQQVQVETELYHGECSLSEIDRISERVENEGYDAVIGIGGGKVLDIAKAVGSKKQVPIILVPTLASTCAAWTPLSVYYDDDGQFIYYRYHAFSTDIVLVDPRIILQSPLNYLVAGIADTLAKWYEADVIIRKLEDPPLSVEIAYHAAKMCQQVLLNDSLDAIQDFQSGTLSKKLVKIIETNIMAGGMVGGFGDEFGRVSGAHAVHNGLTQVENTHHLLHGEKVAYGILLQLALEENWEEIKKLFPFYQQLNLPYSLTSLNLSLQHKAELEKVAASIVKPEETIHLVDENITIERVLLAVEQLEKLNVEYVVS